MNEILSPVSTSLRHTCQSLQHHDRHQLSKALHTAQMYVLSCGITPNLIPLNQNQTNPLLSIGKVSLVT